LCCRHQIRDYLNSGLAESHAFVVFVNGSCFAVSEDLRQYGDYRLHAWIAFEEIGMIGDQEINHFTCVGLEPQGKGYLIIYYIPYYFFFIMLSSLIFLLIMNYSCETQVHDLR
jgi:hypothetical protein